MIDPEEAYNVAWTDQFGALLRDRVRMLVSAVHASGLDNLSHTFQDPFSDDNYRIVYAGEFWLIDLSSDEPQPFMLDLKRLGVTRDL